MRLRPLAGVVLLLLAALAVALPASASDVAGPPQGEAEGGQVASIAPNATSAGSFVTVTGALPNQVAWSCMGSCAVWLRPVVGTPSDPQAGPVVAQAGVMRAGFAVRVSKAALGSAYVASVYRWTGGTSYALLASGAGVVR